MENMAEIKYEDITISDEHLNGYDYDRCKNALWSIHNVIKKQINNPNPDGAGLFTLGVLASMGSFKDKNMDAIVFSFNETVKKIRYEPATKDELEKNGFVFSEYVMADGGEVPKKAPSLNKTKQFTLSYAGNDFKDVILGLKLFADICAKHAPGKSAGSFGVSAGDFFHTADISIAFKNANVKEKEKASLQKKADSTVGIKDMLSEKRFDIISEGDKAFIIAFDKEIEKLGYDYGGDIGTGHGWGPYQIVYGKTGTKSRPVAVRIYVKKDGSILFRMFLNKIDNHREYIENAPAFIKDVFTSENKESCVHCYIKDDGSCGYNSFKPYTIDGHKIVKCSGKAFVFRNTTMEKLSDYMALLGKFYPPTST